MKKFAIILMTIVLFSFSMINTQQEAHAISGKVVSLAAKKMAKEAIKDAAINTAGNLALNHAIPELADKYKAKPGFTLVCLPGGKVDGDCTKPMQVKTDLSSSDKTTLGNAVDSELEKAANGGKNFSKWQKWLDWVAPLFLIGLAVSAITYAIDGDVRDMFNEIAQTALTSIGLMAPVPPTDPEVTDPEGNPIELPAQEPLVNVNAAPELISSQEVTFNTVSSSHSFKFTVLKPSDKVVTIESVYSDPKFNAESQLVISGRWGGYGRYRSPVPGMDEFSFSRDVFANHIYLNAEKIHELSYGSGGGTGLTTVEMPGARPSYPLINMIEFKQNHVEWLQKTMDGNVYQHRTERNGNKSYDNEITINAQHRYDGTYKNLEGEMKMRVNVYDRGLVDFTPYTPELDNYQLDSLGQSAFKVNETELNILPPTAFPYSQPDGTPAFPVPNPEYDPVTNPNVDPNIFVDPNGNPIQDPDGLTVGDPTIIQNPNGNPEYIPPATPTNPNPEPVPVNPTPTSPPAEPFPEGESCQEGLKFPVFSPLKETFSTSFPFSIPWDIERAINAAFGGIGNEKPNFKIALPFMGDTWEINITTPKLFDEWKPFTDTFLLFTFDVLIMFGVYRFVKGAGS